MIASEEVDGLTETGDGKDVEALDKAGFTGVFSWENQRAEAALARFECDGESAFDGAHGAVEGELARDAVIVQVLWRISGSEEGHPNGDGQVERGTLFSDIGRR
ncbi:MAG: hypothetical protein RIS92_838 [Verrucomicrobiota bacterium]